MARTRKILHTSEEVTQHQSIAGSVSKLLTISTPEGTSYTFTDPFHLISKLFDSAGNQVPPDTRLLLFKRRPGEDFGMFIRQIPYASYYDLSDANQRDQRFAAATFHDLGSGIRAISNPEDHDLEIWIDSSVAVDLSQASTRFEVTAIEQN